MHRRPLPVRRRATGACCRCTARAAQDQHGRHRAGTGRRQGPVTVANFIQYVKSGQYNGTIFHRVIGNFMIQGGGFDQNMREKPTQAPIKNEAKNGLKNAAYTIAMARTSDPQSAAAQFFINVANNSPLDYPSRDGW